LIGVDPHQTSGRSARTARTRSASIGSPVSFNLMALACAGRTGCHGASATGTPLDPNLTANRWLWSDGTWAGIAATIRGGVPQPHNYRSPMPALGGATLSADQVNSIAAYVWGLNHAH
jgi:hypothetical protein